MSTKQFNFQTVNEPLITFSNSQPFAITFKYPYNNLNAEEDLYTIMDAYPKLTLNPSNTNYQSQYRGIYTILHLSMALESGDWNDATDSCLIIMLKNGGRIVTENGHISEMQLTDESLTYHIYDEDIHELLTKSLDIMEIASIEYTYDT